MFFLPAADPVTACGQALRRRIARVILKSPGTIQVLYRLFYIVALWFHAGWLIQRGIENGGKKAAGPSPLDRRHAQRSTPMELFIFARFHGREGQEAAVAAALREQVPAVRAEPGCLAIAAYCSVRDLRLFWIHSHWIDEAAFETHAELPHTQRFVERVQQLIDHPFDVTRTHPIT
jgi:quinol monooxygenase YgiN